MNGHSKVKNCSTIENTIPHVVYKSNIVQVWFVFSCIPMANKQCLFSCFRVGNKNKWVKTLHRIAARSIEAWIQRALRDKSSNSHVPFKIFTFFNNWGHETIKLITLILLSKTKMLFITVWAAEFNISRFIF